MVASRCTLVVVVASALLVCCTLASSSSNSITNSRRIVAIGDIHGDLQAFRSALMYGGLIDNEDNWVGGSSVLVQTGDQLDRGNDEPEILELLDQLALSASENGGAVHVLNGNHEIMNAMGDFRYVTREGFHDFGHHPVEHIDWKQFGNFPAIARGRAAVFFPGGTYARKFAERSTVLVLNDTVFVHGGLLPQYARYGVERINAETSAFLRGEVAQPAAHMTAEDGPLWTRMFSHSPGPQQCEILREALDVLGVQRMVVGHTVQLDGIKSHCGDKVWLVDVGMSRAYGGTPQALEISERGIRVLSAESMHEMSEQAEL